MMMTLLLHHQINTVNCQVITGSTASSNHPHTRLKEPTLKTIHMGEKNEARESFSDNTIPNLNCIQEIHLIQSAI